MRILGLPQALQSSCRPVELCRGKEVPESEKHRSSPSFFQVGDFLGLCNLPAGSLNLLNPGGGSVPLAVPLAVPPPKFWEGPVGTSVSR